MKIVPIFLREANDFVEKWHRHSARTSNDGGKYAIGLEHDGEIVGVAIVGRPISKTLYLQDRHAGELLRLCTSPPAPKGSGSKLYSRAKRIWQLMGGSKLHTYTLKHESGATLRGAGIHEAAAEVKGAQWDRKRRPRARKDVHDKDKRRYTEELAEVKP